MLPRNIRISQASWHTPVLRTLRRRRQEDHSGIRHPSPFTEILEHIHEEFRNMQKEECHMVGVGVRDMGWEIKKIRLFQFPTLGGYGEQGGLPDSTRVKVLRGKLLRVHWLWRSKKKTRIAICFFKLVSHGYSLCFCIGSRHKPSLSQSGIKGAFFGKVLSYLLNTGVFLASVMVNLMPT